MQFEQRVDAQSPEDYFESIMLMMCTLREQGVPSALDEMNVYREAYMGNFIREAQRELYQNIVVVCGAWHAPALLDLDKTEAEHAKIVKKLPKTKLKVGVTWIPWTFDRLSMKTLPLGSILNYFSRPASLSVSLILVWSKPTMYFSPIWMTGTPICLVFLTSSIAAALSPVTVLTSYSTFSDERYSFALSHHGQVLVEYTFTSITITPCCWCGPGRSLLLIITPISGFIF